MGDSSLLTSFLPVLELTRGGIVESRHLGAVAVADVHGRLVASYGDPHTVAFLRSSAKPFQAIPLVESGAAHAYDFTPRELALACASHRGLDMHAETVLAMQQKAGVSEADLLCGAHPLDDPETVKRLHLAGQEPTPNRHNCSGKHTGMLAQARHRGLPLVDYVNPQHGVQQSILAVFAEMCGMEPQEVVVGVDGCSAPNFAVPLLNAATAFARLGDPAGLPAARALALRTIFAAMTSHPEMVSAPGSFDTELMHVRPGVIAAKGGAEGYLGLAIARGAFGPDSPALGLALKIADGASRAAGPAGLEALRQLGVLGEAELQALAPLGFGPRWPSKNWRGLAVGEGRTCFELRN
jgi:L-asparaginase II